MTRLQESQLWFNRMLKRITNSVATITWYVFAWFRPKGHKYIPKSSPSLIRISVWSCSFSIWAVTNSTSQSHWAWVKIQTSSWWSTTAPIRTVWRAVWSGSRDRAMRRNWDLISSKFRQHTTLMWINRSSN